MTSVTRIGPAPCLPNLHACGCMIKQKYNTESRRSRHQKDCAVRCGRVIRRITSAKSTWPLHSTMPETGIYHRRGIEHAIVVQRTRKMCSFSKYFSTHTTIMLKIGEYVRLLFAFQSMRKFRTFTIKSTRTRTSYKTKGQRLPSP